MILRFRFNYAWHDGTPAYMQRVNLSQQQSTNSATLMFEWVAKSKTTETKHAKLAAFVNGDEAHEKAASRREMLDAFATVIDVGKPTARDELAGVLSM